MTKRVFSITRASLSAPLGNWHQIRNELTSYDAIICNELVTYSLYHRWCVKFYSLSISVYILLLRTRYLVSTLKNKFDWILNVNSNKLCTPGNILRSRLKVFSESDEPGWINFHTKPYFVRFTLIASCVFIRSWNFETILKCIFVIPNPEPDACTLKIHFFVWKKHLIKDLFVFRGFTRFLSNISTHR